MSEQSPPLFAEFEPPSYEEWVEATVKSLKGRPFEKLTSQTVEGIEIRPFYTAADAPTETPSPGQPPFRRGTQADGYLNQPWLIAQRLDCATPQQFNQALLADLPDLVLNLLGRIEEQAAVTSDVPHMMDALLPLARVLRYGDVRQTDPALVRHVVDMLVARICIGLPSTCASLDNDAAAEMLDKVTAVHTVIATQQNPKHLAAWEETLHLLTDHTGIHGLLAGKATRLLLDTAVFQPEEAAMRMERVLSGTAVEANQLSQMASWIEGFLKGSGLLVLHDQTLWQLLDGWVTQLDPERFQTILPLLRRTFATFSDAARQQLVERVRFGSATTNQPIQVPTFDEEQANKVLPLVAQLLGIKEIGD